MISVHLFREGGGLEHRHDLGLAEAWRGRNGSPLWIDVEDPGEEEARDLADVCGFHPLTVEDCLTPAQPPKVEEFGDYLFLVFRGLRPEEGGDECAVESYKLAAYLGAGTLVTVHKRPVEAVNEVSDQVTRKDLPLERHMDQILHAIVDRMVDRLLPVVDRFEERIEEIEEQVFRDPKPEVLQEVLAHKRAILSIRRLAVPQREMLGRLARRDLPFIDERTSHYFRDVYDHMARIEETTVILTDLATGTMEAYLSIASNRLNEIVKVLTIFSVIWMPLTFIVGVYGMNLKGMPEMEWRWFYPVLLAGMAAIAGGMLLWFKRKRWI